MSGPKRAASDSFSSSQQLVVKRQKSDANLDGSTIALVNTKAQNGALVQSVSFFLIHACTAPFAELEVDKQADGGAG
jgi:hypothetical protein